MDFIKQALIVFVGFLIVAFATMWLFEWGRFHPSRQDAGPGYQSGQGVRQGQGGGREKYTGKSCKRSDGSTGREGYGPGGQLGCWRF